MGEVFIEGLNIKQELSKVRSLIGYCPQFDALIENLTCREHLEFYGVLKGIPHADLPRFVKRKLEQMDLMRYENACSQNLSGGNKRKLSTAVATLGNPKIIFLGRCIS